MSHISTTRAHERNAWLLSAEAPARAPPPPPAGPPPPAALFGPSIHIEPDERPALCSALRGLRAVAARLEEISSLRIAVPRGGMLREILEGGVESGGPLNAGWPDNGCEVTCTLVLGEPGDAASTVGVSAHGVNSVLHASPGDLILSLARQTSCDVLPGRPSLWLTLHAYSSALRGAADGRMLGVSEQAVREMQEQMRGKGEAELQALQRQAGIRR